MRVDGGRAPSPSLPCRHDPLLCLHDLSPPGPGSTSIPSPASELASLDHGDMVKVTTIQEASVVSPLLILPQSRGRDQAEVQLHKPAASWASQPPADAPTGTDSGNGPAEISPAQPLLELPG